MTSLRPATITESDAERVAVSSEGKGARFSDAFGVLFPLVVGQWAGGCDIA